MLEHGIRYKSTEDVPAYLVDELRSCANVITETDYKMQEIFKALQMVHDKVDESPENLVEKEGEQKTE